MPPAVAPSPGDLSAESLLTAISDRLDLREDHTSISEIHTLRQVEMTVTLMGVKSKDAVAVMLNQNFVIIDIDYKVAAFAMKLMMGDQIMKINDSVPPTPRQAQSMLTSQPPTNATKVLIRRRMFTSVPTDQRLQQAGVARKPGYAYMLVTCKKLPRRAAAATFGFRAAITKALKQCIVEVMPSTMAEKYLAFGDTLLDVDGRLLYGKDAAPPKFIHDSLIKNHKAVILVERAVSAAAIKQCNFLLKDFVSAHKEPTMSEDSTRLGLDAAYFHKQLWKRMTPTPILRPPNAAKTRPKTPLANTKRGKLTKQAKKKKTKKTQNTIDDSVYAVTPQEAKLKERTVEDEMGESTRSGTSPAKGGRVSFADKNITLSIGSDVSDETDLEHVPLRYVDSEDDDDDDDDDDEDEEQMEKSSKKKKVVVGKNVKKKQKKKKKRFLFFN